MRQRTGECQMSSCSKREGARERGTDGASEILLFGMAEGTLQSVQQVSASASSGAAGAASATAECGPIDRRKRCTAAGTGPPMTHYSTPATVACSCAPFPLRRGDASEAALRHLLRLASSLLCGDAQLSGVRSLGLRRFRRLRHLLHRLMLQLDRRGAALLDQPLQLGLHPRRHSPHSGKPNAEVLSCLPVA